MKLAIHVGLKPSELTGTGTEYLVVDGFIIAEFFDGNLVSNVSIDSDDEVTKVAS